MVYCFICLFSAGNRELKMLFCYGRSIPFGENGLSVTRGPVKA